MTDAWELTEEEYQRLKKRSVPLEVAIQDLTDEPLIDTMRKRKPRPKTEGKNQ